VHDRAAGADAQVRTVGRDLDELALEAEQGQEVGEVALDEAQRAQVVDLVLREHHRAQVVQLALDLFLQLGQRIGRRVAALEFVFADGVRVHVQQGLPHREFVQIGFEQAADDRFHGCEDSCDCCGFCTAILTARGDSCSRRPWRPWFQPALRLRFLGASMVPLQLGAPQRQANRRLSAGVWRSS
jgi:hypothetical protein